MRWPRLSRPWRGPLRRPGRQADTPAGWNVAELLSAADARADMPERHIWLVRLMEWLRHPQAGDALDERATPLPVLRLRQLLHVLEQHPEHRAAVAGVIQATWREVDATTLLADYGFAPRSAFFDELTDRLRRRLLPATPATLDLAELFGLLFKAPEDAAWLRALDEATLARLGALLHEATQGGDGLGGGLGGDRQAASVPTWQAPFFDAIAVLAAQIRALGQGGTLRPRMSREALADRPFTQLARVAEQLRETADARAAGRADAHAELARQAMYLRALLDACRRAADTVHEHLEEHGVSVGVVFQVDQIRARARRIESLLNCVLADEPGREVAELTADLVETTEQRRSIRALFARHYSMLARKVAERSAETGEHYITRTRAEYRQMLGRALGGGAVLAATTFLKFAILALGLSPFWAGFGAGLNYAVSFVVIYLLHFTVATKQPAMTAPAMAARLADVSDDASVERFVDEVAHLIRSQMAGIIGNVCAVAPVVLAAQWIAQQTLGRPLIDRPHAEHVLHALTLLGPSLWYAAFTGVLLFASSLIAGWAENWFVLHRLDSAIRWNPRITARLGAKRAARWATWWRQHVSGLAANVSLGLMLGLVPVIASFFALPLDVRHVTLSMGQLAAAAGTLGTGVLHLPAFWWCLGAVLLTGLLNVGVSFFFALRVALRSRGIRVKDRARLRRAVLRRLLSHPLSFLLPPRPPRAEPADPPVPPRPPQ
ncbi:MAG: site-specific recombinase [Burkholderiales bacterium]|nr:site-specific recombinase [Burkholderiales bacterium]